MQIDDNWPWTYFLSFSLFFSPRHCMWPSTAHVAWKPPKGVLKMGVATRHGRMCSQSTTWQLQYVADLQYSCRAAWLHGSRLVNPKPSHLCLPTKQARKLGRCDSNLLNLKTLPTKWLTRPLTDWLTGVGASQIAFKKTIIRIACLGWHWQGTGKG